MDAPQETRWQGLANIKVMHAKNEEEEARRQLEIAKQLLEKFEDGPDAEEVYHAALYGRTLRRQARRRKFRRERDRRTRW